MRDRHSEHKARNPEHISFNCIGAVIALKPSFFFHFSCREKIEDGSTTLYYNTLVKMYVRNKEKPSFR